MSCVIAEKANIVIRHMTETEQDFRLFLKWMTDPQTMKYWSGKFESVDENAI